MSGINQSKRDLFKYSSISVEPISQGHIWVGKNTIKSFTLSKNSKQMNTKANPRHKKTYIMNSTTTRIKLSSTLLYLQKSIDQFFIVCVCTFIYFSHR